MKRATEASFFAPLCLRPPDEVLHVGAVGVTAVVLPPGESALRAIDFDEQVILAAVRNLTCGDGHQTAVFELNDGDASGIGPLLFQ